MEIEFILGEDMVGRIYKSIENGHQERITAISFEEIPEEVPASAAVPAGFYEEELQKPEFNVEDYF